jgi:transposase
MSRIDWFRYLRSGLEPMAARFAWTQALLNEGMTLEEWNARTAFDADKIDRLVIANYAAGKWDQMRARPSFMRMLMGKWR